MLELPLPGRNRNEQLLRFVISDLDHAFYTVPHQAISLISKKAAIIQRMEFITFFALCIKYLLGNMVHVIVEVKSSYNIA